MKKSNLLLFVLLILLQLSCEDKETITPVTSNQESGTSNEIHARIAPPMANVTTCGGSFSGSYSTISSYYTYPLNSVDVSCAASGATITVYCSANDVPNKFTILDASGNYVVGSSWLGNASYGGPWGSSLSNSGTTTLTFAKVGSSYKLRVETLTPPNYSYSPNTDFWSVSVSCTCVPTGCSPACPTGYSCVNGACQPNCTTPCGGGYSGSYNVISSYYTYPLQSFDITCAASGATISVYCSANDVPNKFTILDASGNYVVGSSWLGNASYGGPWGGSLSNSGTTTLTFAKVGSSYKLRVETLTPPNYSYSPNSDFWSASISCP